MDVIGRIKKKTKKHICAKTKTNKKKAPENMLLGHRFSPMLKKDQTNNQEPVQALFTIAFHF